MKSIVLLGSSGSIGESTLRVVDALPSRLRVAGLAVNRNYGRALEQALKYGVRHIAVADPEMARRCAAEAPAGVRVHHGAKGVEELASMEGADTVVCALVGIAGLRPVLAAAGRGAEIALATKEVLVAAGAIVTEACRRSGARLIPVDSEHSAILQCLEAREAGSEEPGRRVRTPVVNGPRSDVRRIILTASGGPFASKPEVDLNRVTIAEALKHPRWHMGRKVTVDSATLMNKGFEVLEARWLFDMPTDRIDVLIHPESIVHSLVEFVDGSLLAQMSLPDMRFAIQYALTRPDRVDGALPRLDLAAMGRLHFAVPDETRFPALGLAREADRIGGTLPAVLNAANEVAVDRFLDGTIPFAGIWRLVADVVARHTVTRDPSLDDIVAADAWARMAAAESA